MTPSEPDNEQEDDAFFTDDPDDPNMLRSVPIPTVEWTLADGAVRFRLPEGWEITQRDFGSATFDIPGQEGAEILFVADSMENPAAIAADDLRAYLDLPAGTPVPEDEFAEISAAVRTADGRLDWRKITLRREGTRKNPETGRPWAEAVLWRRICVLPPSHIRMLTVTLSLPLQEGEDENARRTRHDVLEAFAHHAVDAAQFSDIPTRADRIAETPELAAHWFDDIVALRLPPDWQRESLPCEGDMLPSYCYDGPENDSWTLWVQNQVVPMPGLGPERVAEKLQELLEKLVEEARIRGNFDEYARFSDPDDPLAGYLRTVGRGISGPTDSESGVRLRRISWMVAKGASNMLCVVYVYWVAADRIANRPDIVALTDMLEAEVPNALILPDLAAALFE